LREDHGGFARGLLMELLYRYGGRDQREIGGTMGIDYSSVSVGRERFQDFISKDKTPLRRYKKVRNQ
jgi:hypothetical protein